MQQMVAKSEMKIKPVAAYLRVSSQSQDVRSQQRVIKQWAAGQGFSVVWYIDHGVSGATMDRPALEDLDAALAARRHDVVVVYALDRLARNALEGLQLLHRWLASGVRVVCTTLDMDFSGDIGQMVASLLFHVAQMERNRIRERQAAGIRAAKAEGRRWGGGHYGATKGDPARVHALRSRGLTKKEIASATGLSQSTVKRYLRRKEERNGRQEKEEKEKGQVRAQAEVGQAPDSGGKADV